MGGQSSLSEFVRYEQRGPIAIITLDRPSKRNALDTAMVRTIGALLADAPADVAAAVLTSSSEHFSAGLDLTELTGTSVFDGVLHSRGWHEPLNQIQLGTIPVVSVLRGAVIGGGARTGAGDAHPGRRAVGLLRVARRQPRHLRRWWGVGPPSRLIGVHRMADMMLTGAGWSSTRPPASISGSRSTWSATTRGSTRRCNSPAGSPRTIRSPTTRCSRRCPASPRWARTRGCSSSR